MLPLFAEFLEIPCVLHFVDVPVRSNRLHRPHPNHVRASSICDAGRHCPRQLRGLARLAAWRRNIERIRGRRSVPIGRRRRRLHLDDARFRRGRRNLQEAVANLLKPLAANSNLALLALRLQRGLCDLRVRQVFVTGVLVPCELRWAVPRVLPLQLLDDMRRQGLLGAERHLAPQIEDLVAEHVAISADGVLLGEGLLHQRGEILHHG
mmetsp:Transcript_87125/g.243857  ORF Transcript_87125/g.243857 Transcript_87125/m.243857 type:complete len:208 (-) Transcript_87125:237-860(-)